MTALITEPGVYPNISNDRYHGEEICDSPSIGSSGLKVIEGRSAKHYWYHSPLNKGRPPKVQKPPYTVGSAVHDRVLLGDDWEQTYHVLPDDFDWSKTVQMREAIQAAEFARDRMGKLLIKRNEMRIVEAIAEAVEKDELASLLLKSGTPEMTLAARDPVTNVWMRAKPDVLPDTTEIIPDIKTTISAHPDDFERQATKLGYFQSVAHYLDVVDAIYGPAAEKRRFLLIAAEKEPPYPVQIYQIDDEAIQNGRMLNRKALNTFAECVRTGVWPGYEGRDQNPIKSLTMSPWKHAEINRRVDAGELSFEGSQ